MKLRNGRRETINFPSRSKSQAAPDELCKHGFPHGVTKASRAITRSDGSKGFYQVEVAEKDSCTHV